jgi:hypothetical protein
MSKINQRQARTAIHNREPFETHNDTLTGRRWVTGTGALPRWAAEVLYAQRDEAVASPEEGEKFYVVYSYQTPIAWWTPKYGWVRPAIKYSVTTSKHQGFCPLGHDLAHEYAVYCVS